MPIFKSKLEVLLADIKKLDERAKKLTPEEYETFKVEVKSIYDTVDEVADEAKDEVVQEEVHAEEQPEVKESEGDVVPEDKPEDIAPEGEPGDEETPEPKDEYDPKKEIEELKEVNNALTNRLEALEEKLAKYEGFGEGEHQDDEHKDALAKSPKKSTELMHKYFGN